MFGQWVDVCFSVPSSGKVEIGRAKGGGPQSGRGPAVKSHSEFSRHCRLGLVCNRPLVAPSKRRVRKNVYLVYLAYLALKKLVILL